MLKGLFTLIMYALLIFSGFSSVDKGDVAEPEIKAEHNVTVWEADPTHHWGEGIKEMHSFDEDGFCTVCDFEIIDLEDGTFEVNKYNEYGDMVTSVYFEEGVAISQSEYDIEYDNNGNVLREKYYFDSALFSESEYKIIDGSSQLASSVYHFDDGSKIVTKYNEYADYVSEISYDATGAVEQECIYENEYDSGGQRISYKCYTDGRLSDEYIYDYNSDGISYEKEMRYFYADGTAYTIIQDGDFNTLREIEYADDGAIAVDKVYEYIFNDDGYPIEERITVNGSLYSIMERKPDSDGWYYDAIEKIYNQDGTVTVIEYDEFGEIINEYSEKM